MQMLGRSKIQSNYQTTIPKDFRKNFDIDKNTILEWGIGEDGEPKINFRKKKKY